MGTVFHVQPATQKGVTDSCIKCRQASQQSWCSSICKCNFKAHNLPMRLDLDVALCLVTGFNLESGLVNCCLNAIALICKEEDEIQ
jgi:hypothetical protein